MIGDRAADAAPFAARRGPVTPGGAGRRRGDGMVRGGAGGGRGSRVHGDLPAGRDGAFAAIYALVRRIPRGRVMTYGQVATLLGQRLSPRAVGWAMHGCPAGVPWQRVVNASGGCSTERMPDVPPGLQRALLEAEGVLFGPNGTLELARYRWSPPAARGRSRRGEDA
jgi:methylated-DNA-protein-cysteine methyltransferase-like protein